MRSTQAGTSSKDSFLLFAPPDKSASHFRLKRSLVSFLALNKSALRVSEESINELK